MKRYIIKTIPLLLCAVLLLPMIPSVYSETVKSSDLPSVTLAENAEYNGIVLPSDWPNVKVSASDDSVITPPYLIAASNGGYKPSIINIDTGRQLFVDSFLIESTDLKTSYHKPVEYSGNPVLKAETAAELATLPGAVPKSGGVWYDREAGLYKMWYEAGWNNVMAYATSTDGIHWERPALNSNGSNTIINYQTTDSTTVWIDYNADPSQRYKLFVREGNGVASGNFAPGYLYTSANGTTWKKAGKTGNMNDRSTFFYNPFRDKYVFSIRFDESMRWNGQTVGARVRYYHEGDTFLEAATWNWSDESVKLWQKTDSADKKDLTVSSCIPELYNVDAIAYESIMLGMFQIWYGPENSVCNEQNRPKITELQAMYSRDGFYFNRPDRTAFIEASRTAGTWNYGYVQSTGGGIIVLDDEIRIYHIGYSGSYTNDAGVTINGMHVGGSVGFATLRRDGFVSEDGTGTLTTNELTCTKDVKYLFVNANVKNGSLKAEILAPDGRVVEGYSAEDCIALTDDSCCAKITWKNSGDLSFLKGHGFKIRFIMENGEFYSFWLSDEEDGNSDGKLGAGYAGTQMTSVDKKEDTDTTTGEIPTDTPTVTPTDSEAPTATASETVTEKPTEIETVTEALPTESDKATEPPKKKGCAGTAGLFAAVIMGISSLTTLTIIKKKR